jgi:3-oxoacyl-[acyl-carrier protein] reductase
MDLGLKDRVVLVSAGSEGIGLACALGFAAEGARVAICGRDRAKLARAVETAGNRGLDLLAVPADVTDPAAVAALVHSVTAQLGAPDVLLTNAGGPPPGGFDTLDDAKWHAALELTLLSATRLTQAVLPGMRARRWGRIVGIQSYGVRQPIPGLMLSNSLRLAAIGWAKTLSAEVAAEGVTVNTVLPGWTRTGRVDQVFEARAAAQATTAAQEEARVLAGIPMGRMGAPAEIAALAVFLGSEVASYITGTAIPVDGGAVLAAL